MKRAMLGMLALLIGCGEDAPTTPPTTKGAIDKPALSAGVVVKLNRDTSVATFNVPFSEAPPTATEAEFVSDLLPATSFFVKSDESGATANLISAEAVSFEPRGAGQFSCKRLAELLGQVLFFNLTPSGLKLAPGRRYTATLTVNETKLFKAFPSTAFPITVEYQ